MVTNTSDDISVYDLVEEVDPEEWPGAWFQDLIIRKCGENPLLHA
jgi:hypothetical protein